MPRGNGEDTTYVSMRAEDRSFPMKFAYLKDKWAIIWMPLAAFLIASGFGFKTPIQTTNELQVQINTQTSKIRSLDSALVISAENRVRLEKKIDQLLRLSCLSTKIPTRDLILLDIDCPKATQ